MALTAYEARALIRALMDAAERRVWRFMRERDNRAPREMARRLRAYARRVEKEERDAR